MISFVKPGHIDESELKVTDYDVTILLGAAALSIVFLIVIYLASLSPGTAPGELASMAVLP
jgi:hypothetical protein